MWIGPMSGIRTKLIVRVNLSYRITIAVLSHSLKPGPCGKCVVKPWEQISDPALWCICYWEMNHIVFAALLKPFLPTHKTVKKKIKWNGIKKRHKIPNLLQKRLEFTLIYCVLFVIASFCSANKFFPNKSPSVQMIYFLVLGSIFKSGFLMLKNLSYCCSHRYWSVPLHCVTESNSNVKCIDRSCSFKTFFVKFKIRKLEILQQHHKFPLNRTCLPGLVCIRYRHLNKRTFLWPSL